MAIQTYQGKHRTSYRVYWRNPVTKKRQYSEHFVDIYEAKKYEADVLYRLKHDPLSFSPPDDEELTFQEIADKYLTCHTLSKSTYHCAFIALKQEILPHIGQKLVKELSKKDLKNLEQIWSEKGNKQPTLHRKMSYVTTILNWAEEREIIVNPVPNYKIKKGRTLSIEPITERELHLLYNNASPHIQRVITLGANLGMRIGASELLKLTWNCVNWQDRNILILSANKGGPQWRQVPLTDYMFNTLKKWQQKDGLDIEYIVHYRGSQISSIKKGWKVAKEAAGITRKIRPYDLRHLFATRALQNGADLKSVADILGNTPKMVLQTYQHVIDDMKVEAVNKACFNFLNTEAE